METGGAVWVRVGDGGVRGTLSDGIVVEVVGVAGVGCEFIDVATAPGGGGCEVLALWDPGRTIGLESEMLGLSAYPLLSHIIVSNDSNPN